MKTLAELVAALPDDQKWIDARYEVSPGGQKKHVWIRKEDALATQPADVPASSRSSTCDSKQA